MSHVIDYIAVIDHIFGTFFDATYGFDLQLKELTAQQEEKIKAIDKSHDRVAEIHRLDQIPFNFAIGHHANVVHQVSFHDYKARNWPDGPNYQWSAKMAVVTMFEYWENRYRKLIAEKLGMEKDDLKIDEFGALCTYRNSILHNLSRAHKDFKKLKAFNWFKPDEEIILTISNVHEIVIGLKAALLKLESA